MQLVDQLSQQVISLGLQAHNPREISESAERPNDQSKPHNPVDEREKRTKKRASEFHCERSLD
jgi:hypothetical protein